MSVADLDLKCEVCGKPAIGVCNAIGPVSAAFCKECLTNGVQPYGILIAYLSGAVEFPANGEELRAGPAEWTHGFVDATLAHYKKSWDDFAHDIREVNKESAEMK